MLLSVHLMGNFWQSRQPGCNSRNKTKLGDRLRLLYGLVDCFNFTTTSVVEKHTRQKLCHFCRYVEIAKLFCQKMFGPDHPGWSVHTGSQSPRFRSPDQPGFSFEQIEFFFDEKSGEAGSRKPSQLGWLACYLVRVVKIQLRLTWNNLFVQFLNTV